MFYFYGIVIGLYNFLLYAIFRSGIYDYLRLSKISKSNIKKNRKGFKNYWFYQSINKQTPLGILYILNYIFLTFSVIFIILAVTMGFIKALQPVLFHLSIILCIIEIPSTIIATICSNNAEYGRPFVWFAKRKHMKGFYSSLIDMFSWSVTVLLICLSFKQL